jgi:PKHD-type hydroxylase
MISRITAMLAPDRVVAIRARLEQAPWEDGRATAGHQSAQAKSNLQLPQHDPIARELGEEIVRALERSAPFVSATLPRHVFPPLFNRFQAGMSFGVHVDNAVRQIPGTAHRLRTDLSATLFLSAPEDYEGGELVIEDTYGPQTVKLPAGDMVVYPSSSVHRVLPVTRGERTAAFFWIQSMVRDDGGRSLLHELDAIIRELALDGAGNQSLVRLTACYHNLLRRWAEV